MNSALVVDAVTLQPLAGATVFAQFDGLAASATTGADGIMAFPQFTADAATSDAEFMQREPLTLEASADGYLAIRKPARLTNVGRRVVLSLIPEDSGVVTPLIDAALGGRFQIPGVGVLNVDPGALAFDTRVRLIPIPDSSTSPEEVEGELAFEVWAASVDQGGQENSSLSSALGGVELTMAPRALPTPVAGAVRSWTVHRFDRFWTRTDSAPATGGGSAGATAPIAAGFNVLEHVPLAPDEDEGCEWSAWEVGLEPIGSSIPGAGATSASVNCGVYTAAVSVSVTSGTTSTTALSINVGVAGEIGLEAGALFGSISAKTGLNISGSYESGTATTTMTQSSKGTPPSGTISGQSQGTQSAPWSCVSGTASFGVGFVTYKMIARRECTTPGGTPITETENLGEITLPDGVSIGWAAAIDEGCSEDCEGAALPELPE